MFRKVKSATMTLAAIIIVNFGITAQAALPSGETVVTEFFEITNVVKQISWPNGSFSSGMAGSVWEAEEIIFVREGSELKATRGFFYNASSYNNLLLRDSFYSGDYSYSPHELFDESFPVELHDEESPIAGNAWYEKGDAISTALKQYYIITGSLNDWADHVYRIIVVDEATARSIIGDSGISESTPIAETPSSWAVTQVNAAIAANLVPASLQSNYIQAMTRAEFCALVVALYETVKGEPITGRTTFSDTNDVNVQKAAAIGVVSGTNTERRLFSPDNTLTREMAAVMLARLADVLGKPLPAQESAATDKSSFSSWAVGAIGQIQAAGIMSSTSDTANVFSPQSPYTREQSIVTVLRLFDLLK